MIGFYFTFPQKKRIRQFNSTLDIVSYVTFDKNRVLLTVICQSESGISSLRLLVPRELCAS